MIQATAEQAPAPALPSGVKRALDVVGAAAGLVALAPLYAFIALGVRLSSGGQVIYSQQRIGLGGRSFRFYKFRSMVPDADAVLHAHLAADPQAREEWDTYQKLQSDPRITRFGRFIRKTSLDELPQLWNVLTGDMSLVGPRPCMPDQRRLYGQHWNTYCAVRPGVTGLWQVSGRNGVTYGERVALDARYVQSWSLALDARILVKTVSVVLTGHGSR